MLATSPPPVAAPPRAAGPGRLSRHRGAAPAAAALRARGPRSSSHRHLPSHRTTRISPLRANLDDLLGDLDVPDIDCDLATYQEDAGALMSEEGIALTFNQDGEAVKAYMEGAAVVDLTHWGRLRVSGDDRLRFLHNMTTNAFTSASPGQSLRTTFVTPSARTIDLATAYVQSSGVLLAVSPGTKGAILKQMDKYVFPADKVDVADISDMCAHLAVVGPGAGGILEAMGAADAVALAPGAHTVLDMQGSPVIVARGAGLPGDGFVLMPDQAVAGELWRLLVVGGAVPMGSQAYESIRVVQGVPAPGAELTDDYNPYEAGLCDTVSLRKGCYMGQETLAKVFNTGRLKQELWGIQLDEPVSPGDDIVLAGTEDVIGVVTSVAEGAAVKLAHYRYWGGNHFALGYVRQRAGGEALKVAVGPSCARGMLLDVPHAVRRVPEAQRPEAAPEAAAEAKAPEEDEEAEARRKAEKLAAMQAKMDAYLAAQKAKAAKEG